MKPQTISTIKEIVRFFIGCYGRGNATTVNTKTIHAEVCKQLKITRQANRKNYFGLVTECLRILKIKVVLFETIAEKENDLLNESITVDNRRIYGLTAAAENYLTAPAKKDEEELPICSDKFITKMLQHFDVLPQHEPQPTLETAPEEESMPENNVQRLVATVRNRSAEWPARSTPADLLGSLYELNVRENAPALDMMASAERLGWPDRPNPRRENYTACRSFLMQHGLVTAGSNRKRKQGRQEVSVLYGIKLTPLGVEVVLAGNFADDRPPAERSATAAEPKKAGTMLKGQKQQPAEEKVSTTPPAGLSPEEVQRMIEAAVRAAMAGQQTWAPAAPATEPAPPPKRPEAYSDRATMALVLETAVPAIIESFNRLIDPPGTENPTTGVNTGGLYLALTEIEKAVRGLKAYVSEVAGGVHEKFSFKLLAQYAENYRACAAALETQSRLPVMGDKIIDGTRRTLRGDKAIDNPVFNRAVEART